MPSSFSPSFFDPNCFYSPCYAFGWYERGAALVTGAARGSSHGRKKEGQRVYAISKVFFVLNAANTKHTLWFMDGAGPPQQ